LIEQRSALEILMAGGEHDPDVIRQRQNRAHRNSYLPLDGQRCGLRPWNQIRRRTCDRPLSSVRQTDNDQTRTTTGQTITDRQAAAKQRVAGINHPDLSDSPLDVHGIM
jgi:hypothetical protein